MAVPVPEIINIILFTNAKQWCRGCEAGKEPVTVLWIGPGQVAVWREALERYWVKPRLQQHQKYLVMPPRCNMGKRQRAVGFVRAYISKMSDWQRREVMATGHPTPPTHPPTNLDAPTTPAAMLSPLISHCFH